MAVTTPTAQGYPDWQAYPSWRSQQILSASRMNYATGPYTLAAVSVLNWSSVHLRIEPSAGYGTVQLQWFADAALSVNLGIDTWSVSATTGLSCIIPAQGPYVQASLTVTSAANMVGAQYFTGANVPAVTYEFPVGVMTITQTAITVPASGAVSYPVRFITRGLGMMTFSPADATGMLQVQMTRFNPDGSVSAVIQDYGAPTARLVQQVPVVSDMYGIRIVNNDGAASHTFTVQAALGLGA